MKDLNNFINPTFPGVLFANTTEEDTKTGDPKETDPTTAPGTEVAEED